VVNPQTSELVGLIIGFVQPSAREGNQCTSPAGTCASAAPFASAFLSLEPIFRQPLFCSPLRKLGAARPTEGLWGERDQTGGSSGKTGEPLEVAPAG
jgi:hypothetical protein